VIRSRRHASASCRGGFALPAAIIALVLLSALVAGALFIATEELRAGGTEVAGQRALAAAEWGLDRAIVAWDTRRNVALAVGATATIEDMTLPTGERVEITATRVQRDAFWVTARASVFGDGRGVPARHTVAASLRLLGPEFPREAALAAAGLVTVVDAGTVDGRDVAPAEWGARMCADAPETIAGVAVRDSALACGVTCSGTAPAGITGTPPMRVTPDAASDSASFGDMTREALTRRATVVLDGGALAPRPSTVGTECDRTDPLNWGDPLTAGACADHVPVIRVRGSATLAAGSTGQGVLLVDGDLRVDAGARFAGVVLAAGDIEVTGPGAEIVGLARAGDADAAAGSRVAAGGAIRFASCAVRRAALGASRVARTPGRWWAELR